MEQMYIKVLKKKFGEQLSAAETVQPGAQILANTNGGAFTFNSYLLLQVQVMKFHLLTKDMILIQMH
jgi:hypothetical protein